MALTPEELSTAIISLDRQNKRLHFIVAALLRSVNGPTQEQVLQDLKDVDPYISAEAFEAQYDACALVEQILSFSKGTDVTRALHVSSDDKQDS